MNRTLLTVLISAGALLAGCFGTALLYEAVVVVPLKNDLQATLDAGEILYDSAGYAVETIDSCRDAVSELFDLSGEYFDAYKDNRAAVDDFFDRYSYVAGDAAYLYSELYSQSDKVTSAQSAYSSLASERCYLD